MANVIHIHAGLAYWRGEIDFVNDDIKIALLNAHTPKDATQYFSQVKADEVVGPGYLEGGQSLVGKSVTLSGRTIVFGANDTVWAVSTLAASHAVIYKDTGNPATSPLFQTKDFGGIKTSENAPFTVKYSNDGVLRMAQ